MKQKRDFQEFLITTGCHFQLLRVTEEVEGTNEDIEGQDWVDNDLTGDTEILEAIGGSLLAWAHSLSGDGSRGGLGAYSDIPKSKEFFAMSLCWPDWWFRSMYRQVSLLL